jgi:hypothetical protein
MDMPNRTRHHAAGIFSAVVLAALLTGTAGVSAAEPLTASDWQYLKTIGYDEHSYGLERATKGQRKRLHKIINNRRLSEARKGDMIGAFLSAIPIGAVPK